MDQQPGGGHHRPSPDHRKEDTVQYMKPFSTLAVGMALGYFIVPKIISRVR
jgi:hypothetical protein